jgi:hypothetical protein
LSDTPLVSRFHTAKKVPFIERPADLQSAVHCNGRVKSEHLVDPVSFLVREVREAIEGGEIPAPKPLAIR